MLWFSSWKTSGRALSLVHPAITMDLETAGLLKSQDPEVISWAGPDRVQSRRVGSSCSKQCSYFTNSLL